MKYQFRADSETKDPTCDRIDKDFGLKELRFLVSHLGPGDMGLCDRVHLLIRCHGERNCCGNLVGSVHDEVSCLAVYPIMFHNFPKFLLGGERMRWIQNRNLHPEGQKRWR